MKDLKFSAFFNKSGYGDSVVEDYIPEDGMEGGHRLRHGYAIQSKRKPDDDFPWRFNHFVVDYLGGIDISFRARRQFSGVGYARTSCSTWPLLPQLRECVVLGVFGSEGFEAFDIGREVSVGPPLGYSPARRMPGSIRGDAGGGSGTRIHISLHHTMAAHAFVSGPTVATRVQTDGPILDRLSHLPSRHHDLDPDMPPLLRTRNDHTQVCSSRENELSSM